jgi:hypothetical protein
MEEQPLQTLALADRAAVAHTFLLRAPRSTTPQQSLALLVLERLEPLARYWWSLLVSGYAFVNAEMIVVQAIGGELDERQLAQFEHDYGILFGAEFYVPVLEDVTVWIGGRYNPENGAFAPPEPQPTEETDNATPTI